jgi:hypothetical protein
MKFIIAGLVVLLVGLAMTGVDCTAKEAETGTVEVLITSTLVEKEASDTQSQFEITSLMATVSEVKVYTAVAAAEDSGEPGEWVELYVANESFELLQITDKEQFLAFADVATTSYSQVLMVIDKLDVTLSEGSKRTIIPDKPFNFIGEFVVFAGQTTTVLFNFDIDKSVTIVDNETVIQPLADVIMNIRYEEPD